MANWMKAAASQPEITDLFERVARSMGSMRQEAFAELRRVLTAPESGLRHEYDAELAELAELDLESTQFETRFDAVRTKVIDELAAEGSASEPGSDQRAADSMDALRQHPQDPVEGVDGSQAAPNAQREHREDPAEG